MAFDPKKKLRSGPPDHRQTIALSSVEGAYSDLIRLLLSASGSHAEMKAIISQFDEPINLAKLWILNN
jgi:hypothetical protein